MPQHKVREAIGPHSTHGEPQGMLESGVGAPEAY